MKHNGNYVLLFRREQWKSFYILYGDFLLLYDKHYPI